MKNAVPLYKHVYQQVIDRIVKGELGPGAMLPSEKELGAEFGVSQGTARKALSELELKGIVQRRQGLGTFVTTTTPESDLFHFFRLRRLDGSPVKPELASEIIVRRSMKPKEQKLFNELSDEVYQIDRVRLVDGKPAVLETTILPVPLFPGLEERRPLPNAIYAMFQRSYGIAIVRADEQLRAVQATSDDAVALDLKPGTPLMEICRNAIDITDRVVELRFSRYVTDRLHYEVTLQ